MTTLGFIPAAPVVVPAVTTLQQVLTWTIGVGGAILYTVKGLEQVTAQDFILGPVPLGPPVPTPPSDPEEEFFADSPIVQDPVVPPPITPPTPLAQTQDVVVSSPKPVSDPQAPLTDSFVPTPTPEPPALPGGRVLGGAIQNGPWGGLSGERTRLAYQAYSSLDLSGFAWDRVVYGYRLKNSSVPYVWQPYIQLKLSEKIVYTWEPATSSQVFPIGSDFSSAWVFDSPEGGEATLSTRALIQAGGAKAIPASPYVPIPEAEPQPEPKPQTAPIPFNPITPIPTFPPDTVPLPDPNEEPTPLPSPTPWPIPVPAPPKPGPATTPDEATPVQPNSPNPLPPVDTEGRPVTTPPVVTTSVDQHTVGNDVPVVSTGPAPNLPSMAKELGRIEMKLNKIIKPDSAPGPDWADLFNLLFNLASLLESPVPAALYRLQSVCEKNEQGQPIDQAVEVQISPAPSITALVQRVDALTQLMQGLKDFKQPICSTPVIPPTGDPVTINWESAEYSPFGNNRLRKRFVYFDQSGATLEQTVDHWKDFVWQAGSVIVSAKGTALGKPQVWGATAEEAKRVINHAAAITGADMSNVEWLVSSPNDPRYGVVGEMHVMRGKNGTFGITKRGKPDGLPPALG